MAALMEGVDLALERSPDGLIVETDCSVAMRMIMDTEANRSPVAAMVGDIRQLLASRPHKIMLIKQEQNKVSHALAQMGRLLPKTAVWLRSAPDEVDILCQQDCNSVSG